MSADNYLYITRDNKVHDLNGSTDYTREQIDNGLVTVRESNRPVFFATKEC